MSYKKSQRGSTSPLELLGLLAFACVIGLTSLVYQYATLDQAIIAVTGKERVGGDENGKYLVDGENETFENTDAFFHFKFDSRDVQRDLKVGETFDCEVYGWRIGLFSMSRNILECEKVK